MKACPVCDTEFTPRQVRRGNKYCSRDCHKRSTAYATHEEKLAARRETYRRAKRRAKGKPVPKRKSVKKPGLLAPEPRREPYPDSVPWWLWADRVWALMDPRDWRVLCASLAALPMPDEERMAA